MSQWVLSKPEKRNYRRLDVQLTVDLMIEGKKVNTKATNISCGGLFLPIKKNSIKERTDIEVTLSLPDQQKQVRVVGEVARFQDGSFLRRRPEGVGIQFRGLYDDNILAIDRFIKNRLH
ncbi:MAG: PilZ domain-containing protein [Deltaproteobacteria bacterium]|nr:PilZ domain-containing protein [Deltaproteobacteria bacterium]